MMKFIKTHQGCVNATIWRGFAAGTVMLSRAKGDNFGGLLTLGFAVRSDGFQRTIDGAVFQLHSSADFKYALRSLHRRGFRKVKLTIQKENRAETLTIFRSEIRFPEI